MYVTATRGTGNLYFTISVVKGAIKSTSYYFRDGYYLNTSNYAYFDFQAVVTNGVVTLNEFNVVYAGSVLTSSSTFEIYYR